VCTQCYSGYFLSGGTCLRCYTGVSNCAICLNSTYCTFCYSDSYLSAASDQCFCNSPLVKVSNLCATLGCASAYRFGTTTACLACNTTQHFQYSNGICSCQLGYATSGSTCLVICGDGRKLTEDCDDGNVVSGDGCSSSCTPEADYSCFGGSLYSKSICVYVGAITVELTQINRLLASNTAELTFTISPNIRGLTGMNFNHFVSLTVGNKSVRYSSSYSEAGVLTVLVDFDSSIEGETATFTLAYNSSLVGLTPTVVSLKMVGHNEPLNIATPTSLENITLYLSYVAASLLLLQLLLSLLFHRMIGVETMQIGQVVFFVRYLLQNGGAMAVYNIYPLQYINGYNFFGQYTNVLGLDSVTMRLGLGKNFAFNVMVQVGLIVLAWLGSVYFARKVSRLKWEKADHSSLGAEIMRRAMAWEYRLFGCVFVLSVYAYLLCVFALLTSVQPSDEADYQLPRVLFVFTVFVIGYLGVYLNAQMLLSWRPKYDEEEGHQFRYVSVFLTYQMLLGVLFIGLYSISYALEAIAGVQALFLLYLLLARPYFLLSQNVLLILGQLVGLFFTGMLVLSQFIKLSDQTMGYLVVGELVLLAVAGVTGMVRLYIHGKFNARAFKLLHQEEDRLKGKDTFSKKEFKKRQEELKVNQQAIPTLTQTRHLREAMEKEELLRVRARLKAEYKYKIEEQAEAYEE
jgi:cysteine-rich repeat protein